MNFSESEFETPPAQRDPSVAHNGNVFQEKPVKAIIGLGMLIAISLLLHEVNQFHADLGSPHTMAHRPHMPSSSSH